MRVVPGKLSVSRAFGDIEAKSPLFNGNPNVVIAKPEIKFFEINQNHDFIVIACDGIFENLKNKELTEIIWKNVCETPQAFDIHHKCGLLVEAVVDECIAKRFSDNLTVVLISFKDELIKGESECNDNKDKLGLGLGLNTQLVQKIKIRCGEFEAEKRLGNANNNDNNVNKDNDNNQNMDKDNFNSDFYTVVDSEEKGADLQDTPTHRVKDYSKLSNFLFGSNGINNDKEAAAAATKSGGCVIENKKILENIFKTASNKTSDKFKQKFILLNNFNDANKNSKNSESKSKEKDGHLYSSNNWNKKKTFGNVNNVCSPCNGDDKDEINFSAIFKNRNDGVNSKD